MSTKFYIKDENGIFLSTDGKVKYTCLEGKELFDFLKTEDGKARSFHVDIDENGDKIGIEAEPKMVSACAEQRERDRYRHKLKAKLNITIISANTMVSIPGEDDIELLETVVDEDANVEESAMHNLDLETLRNALHTLSNEEYCIIYHLYLAKIPMSEEEIAKRLGISQQAVSKRKKAIFSKLRNFF